MKFMTVDVYVTSNLCTCKYVFSLLFFYAIFKTLIHFLFLNIFLSKSFVFLASFFVVKQTFSLIVPAFFSHASSWLCLWSLWSGSLRKSFVAGVYRTSPSNKTTSRVRFFRFFCCFFLGSWSWSGLKLLCMVLYRCLKIF